MTAASTPTSLGAISSYWCTHRTPLTSERRSHIHWYERMWPLTANGTVDSAAIQSNHTYVASQNSLIHIVEGNAGNIESHSTLGKKPLLNTTAVLDQENYGFGSLRIHNRTTATYTFIKGSDGSAGDYVTIVKPSQDSTGSQGSNGSKNSQGKGPQNSQGKGPQNSQGKGSQNSQN